MPDERGATRNLPNSFFRSITLRSRTFSLPPPGRRGPDADEPAQPFLPFPSPLLPLLPFPSPSLPPLLPSLSNAHDVPPDLALSPNIGRHGAGFQKHGPRGRMAGRPAAVIPTLPPFRRRRNEVNPCNEEGETRDGQANFAMLPDRHLLCHLRRVPAARSSVRYAYHHTAVSLFPQGMCVMAGRRVDATDTSGTAQHPLGTCERALSVSFDRWWHQAVLRSRHTSYCSEETRSEIRSTSQVPSRRAIEMRNRALRACSVRDRPQVTGAEHASDAAAISKLAAV